MDLLSNYQLLRLHAGTQLNASLILLLSSSTQWSWDLSVRFAVGRDEIISLLGHTKDLKIDICRTSGVLQEE